MRFHIGPEEGIDPCLIARALCLEPIQDLMIESNGDRRFWFRETQYGAFEEGLALLRDIRSIDLPVFERVYSCPICPRPLLGSALLHRRSIFSMI